MLVKKKIYLIEYNVRFGDPECQPLIFLLKSDLLKILNNCIDKKLNKTRIKWKKEYAISVVMVNKGYPNSFKKNSVIKNLDLITGKGLVSRNPETSRARRSLPLSPATVNLLHEVRGNQVVQQSLIGEAWHSNWYAFTQPGGHPIDPDLVTRAFNKMVKETGVPHLTPHGLRHAYATAALEASIDPKVVSQHLGHASVSTTYDIYAHVIPELEADSAKKIDPRLLGK